MRFTLDGEPFDLTPDLVRACIDGYAPEAIHSYWVDIDGTRWPVKQVISLATGVKSRQRFQSQSARRWLRNLGFAIGSGNGATAKSSGPPAKSTSAKHVVLRPALSGRPADVVLIGCVKSKRSVGAEARDLYTSDYFGKMRRYAERSGLPWFILSAEHGLVAPGDWLEPYERYLPDTSAQYRSTWGRKVVAQLESALGSLLGKQIEVHAGAAYVNAIQPVLRGCGAEVRDPLHGLSIGRRLSWYLRCEAGPGIDEVLDRLRDQVLAKSLADVIATGGEGLKTPGMYSWWVDEVGADDLTLGLGYQVRAGLLYAGLAGATRSGGSSSSNTLWGRIATMHLGKKHEFSTLRWSLGSILASANGEASIDETEMTKWMYAHLRVVPVPVADADTLDDLETAVLTHLDPPLNLAKVPATPLRLQLSALRKRYSRADGTVTGSERDQSV